MFCKCRCRAIFHARFSMKTLTEIQQDFPTLYAILGEDYISALKSEQGALAIRATINPFFTILYSGSNTDYSVKVESVFRNIVEKNVMPIERLIKFTRDKNPVNIQNFLNETIALYPLIGHGIFIDEGDEKTPDFVASICGSDVALECVSVNADAQETKDKHEFIRNFNAEFKKWNQDNSGIF